MSRDRKRGALFGLAIGDALGAAVEFRRPGEFERVTGYRAGGPHGLNPGEWTDDTSMALALADSLGRGWDLDDQINCYCNWWMNGKYSVNGFCFDIGTTTRHALSEYLETHNASRSGDPDEAASGNGSIMRLAPIPIRFADLYPKDIRALVGFGEMSSVPTHASPQCVSACRYLTLVMAALINGENRDVVLAPDWKPLQELIEIRPLHPLVLRVAQGSFRLPDQEIKGSGWVVQSLEAALWSFNHANDFEEAVLEAVNLGDDADTTGAVCGQLAGAYWGESAIPRCLRDGLARKDMIEKALTSLGV